MPATNFSHVSIFLAEVYIKRDVAEYSLLHGASFYSGGELPASPFDHTYQARALGTCSIFLDMLRLTNSCDPRIMPAFPRLEPE
jgi:hypothetical protein